MILLSFIIFKETDSGSLFLPQAPESFILPYFSVTAGPSGEAGLLWQGTGDFW